MTEVVEKRRACGRVALPPRKGSAAVVSASQLLDLHLSYAVLKDRTEDVLSSLVIACCT